MKMVNSPFRKSVTALLTVVFMLAGTLLSCGETLPIDSDSVNPNPDTTSDSAAADSSADSADTSVEEETAVEKKPDGSIDSDADSLDGITIESADELARIGMNRKYPLDGDYFLVADIDLSEVIDQHERSGADLTVVTKRMNLCGEKESVGKIIVYSENGNITEFVEHTQLMCGEYDVSTNILVFTKTYLMSLIDTAIAHGYREFYQQALPAAMANSKFCIYNYEGFYATVDSLAGYFARNMELLEGGTRAALFGIKDRPVYTKVRNTPPTKYAEGACVKNSLIADGCVIEGTVENSILFRGVHVKKGTVIKNSIMLQNSVAGENVTLNCVIADKNVIIRDDKLLSGSETLPYYIAKGKMI